MDLVVWQVIPLTRRRLNRGPMEEDLRVSSVCHLPTFCHDVNMSDEITSNKCS